MEIKAYKILSEYNASDIMALHTAIVNGVRIFHLTSGHWRRDGCWEELQLKPSKTLTEFVPIIDSLLSSGVKNVATEQWLVSKGIISDLSSE